MYRILVLEDDPLFGLAIQTSLQATGYSCVLLHTEDELESQIQVFQPHVVLLDMCVQGKTISYERIKSCCSPPNAPCVILMTGHLDLSQNIAKKFPGIRYFLTKPFSRQQLLKVIQEGINASCPTPPPETNSESPNRSP